MIDTALRIEPVLRPFRAEDVLEVQSRNDNLLSKSEDGLYWTKVFAERGPAYTALLEGKVVGCAGVMIIYTGVGEAWGLISEELAQYKFWLHKTVKRKLYEIMVKHGLHRLQATADIRHEVAVNWLLALGFEEEGILRQHGPNKESMRIFSIIT